MNEDGDHEFHTVSQGGRDCRFAQAFSFSHVYFEALDRADRFARGRIPNDCGLVMAPRGEAFAIRAESHIRHTAIMRLECHQEFSRLAVPNLYCRIAVAPPADAMGVPSGLKASL